MIKVTIKNDHIEIKGHAMYDDHGKDIVCASVSTLLISNINLILKLDENAIKYKSEEGLIKLDIIKRDKIINVIISNMIEHLEELEKKYKKNIKIYKEV